MSMTVRMAAAWLAALGAGAPALAGQWGAVQTLSGPVLALTTPAPPRVAMNAQGHGLMAGNLGNTLRYAERRPDGSWSAATALPGAPASAGPVAIALGRNEVAALAWTTPSPSRLLVAWRTPGGQFSTPVEAVPGAQASDLRLAVACDGSVTLLWMDLAGVRTSRLAGAPGSADCNGVPGGGAWSAARPLSASGAGASLPDLALNDAGAALAVWQQGASGQPKAILAARMAADGTWSATEKLPTWRGRSTWNPKPAIDAAGNAAVAWQDSGSLVLSRRAAGGAWSAPQALSGRQAVYYPALAMSGQGDVVVAWQALDSQNLGSVWQRTAPAGAAFGAAVRLSGASEATSWPSAAWSADGSLALVSWTDNAANQVHVALRQGGAWNSSALGRGWWNSRVPVAAGGGAALIGWAVPDAVNYDAALLQGRDWK